MKEIKSNTQWVEGAVARLEGRSAVQRDKLEDRTGRNLMNFNQDMQRLSGGPAPQSCTGWRAPQHPGEQKRTVCRQQACVVVKTCGVLGCTGKSIAGELREERIAPLLGSHKTKSGVLWPILGPDSAGRILQKWNAQPTAAVLDCVVWKEGMRAVPFWRLRRLLEELIVVLSYLAGGFGA